jgi:hypothetical protein
MVSFLFVNSIISVANVYIKEVVRNRDQTKELTVVRSTILPL